jgi:hypothetical protein
MSVSLVTIRFILTEDSGTARRANAVGALRRSPGSTVSAAALGSRPSVALSATARP